MAPPTWPRPTRLGLHLFALSGLGIAIPLLGVLADSSTFFVVHGAGPARIVATTIAIVLLPAAILVLPYGISTKLQIRGAWVLALAAVWLLATLIGVQITMALIGGPAWALVVGGVALGSLLAWAYPRVDPLQQFLSYLAFAPVVMAGLFLLTPPMNDLVRPTTVAAAGASTATDAPPVVVIVLDELPTGSLLDEAGAVDASRYPNLARLAGDGTWYPNATGVAAYTHEALPAILTGRYVSERDVPPTASAHPENLFTLLAGTYEIRALEQTTRLCPPSLCDTPVGDDEGLGLYLADLAAVYGNVALPKGGRPGLPAVDEAWSRYWEGPRVEAISAEELDAQRSELRDMRQEVLAAIATEDRSGEFLAAVEQIERSAVPTLDFIHVVLPHRPWLFHADGSTYGNLEQAGLEDQVWVDQQASDFGLQRHLLQVEYVDGLIGAVLDRLDGLGTYDDTTLMVVGDHALSFEVGEHRRLANDETFTSMMPVPLIVKPTGSVPVGGQTVVGAPVEVVDLLPTLASLTGIALPWEVDGWDLTADIPAERTRRTYNRGSTFTTEESPLAARNALASEIAAHFGSGASFQPYALAGAPDLIGATLEGPLDDSGPCWRTTGHGRPEDGTVGWVTGNVENSASAKPLRLAIATDGTIAATTGTSAGHAVTAVTDPDHWVDGSDISVGVLGVGDGTRPRPLPNCRT